MKKTTLFALAGILSGIILTGIIIFLSAQSVMLKEEQSKYDFEQSVQVFEASALASGWRISATHDMQNTMANFGKEVLQAKVFEICHPEHAYEILSRDKERIVTSMLPCRVAVCEKSDGKTYVSWMNTGLVGGMMKGVVPKVMKQASKESEAIVAVLLQ